MRFVKFEEEGKFLLAQVESEIPMEAANAITLTVHQFLSNMVDDEYNCNKLRIGRRVHSELKEITAQEFSKLLRENFKELENQDFSQPVKIAYGKIKPMFLIDMDK